MTDCFGALALQLNHHFGLSEASGVRPCARLVSSRNPAATAVSCSSWGQILDWMHTTKSSIQHGPRKPYGWLVAELQSPGPSLRGAVARISREAMSCSTFFRMRALRNPKITPAQESQGRLPCVVRRRLSRSQPKIACPRGGLGPYMLPQVFQTVRWHIQPL